MPSVHLAINPDHGEYMFGLARAQQHSRFDLFVPDFPPATHHTCHIAQHDMSAAIASQDISSKKNMNSVPLVDYRLMDLDAGKYKRQVRVQCSVPHCHVRLCTFFLQVEHYEYYWGLQRGQLDLETPLNHLQRESLDLVFPILTANLHRYSSERYGKEVG